MTAAIINNHQKAPTVPVTFTRISRAFVLMRIGFTGNPFMFYIPEICVYVFPIQQYYTLTSTLRCFCISKQTSCKLYPITSLFSSNPHKWTNNSKSESAETVSMFCTKKKYTVRLHTATGDRNKQQLTHSQKLQVTTQTHTHLASIVRSCGII